MNTWIIGGTSGIGESVAEILRTQRRPLYVTDTNVDVCKYDALDDFVASHPHIDQVVYCAGIQILGFLGNGAVRKTFEHIMDVNVNGFIRVMDVLRKYRSPVTDNMSVVAIVSDASRTPMRGSIAYCASKAALAQAIRVAARELAPWRINGVSPGIVDGTPMTNYIDSVVPILRGWTVSEAQKYEQSLIPMRRRALPEEVAQLIVSVLDGPAYMTGSIVDITGGK